PRPGPAGAAARRCSPRPWPPRAWRPGEPGAAPPPPAGARSGGRGCPCTRRSPAEARTRTDTPQGVKMTLEEEFKRGQSLESEFAQVLEARRLGRDIPRPGAIEAKSDLEVSLKRTWRQAASSFSRIDFTDGPTLFWSTLIGLIVMSWCLTLFRY
ncbi:unnamed protein product, partial [Prorocentrum cordatum]